ncbi:MAG: hypothetical protein ACRC6X_01900 [Culicoidibacterales bacterium]
MRWGIETAFRTLKYTVGLMALHTKKVAFILQELYSKLLLFNLCQLVVFFDITEYSINVMTLGQGCLFFHFK